LWAKESREALFVRHLGASRNASYETYKTHVESRPAEDFATVLICLIHQANYRLRRNGTA